MKQELLDLEKRIAEAVVRADADFMEQVWADEFVYTGVRGEVKSKAEVLAELKSRELEFDLLRFDDINVHTYGETAVVTGRATTRGRSKQGAITGEFRYTRVYVKREGRWRLVAFQATPLVR